MHSQLEPLHLTSLRDYLEASHGSPFRKPEADKARREAQSTPAERGGLVLSGNVEIITRFEYAFRAGDQATINELCHSDLVDHNPAPGA